ncbi:hypothetical protein CC117_11185 [Parafrankia colletiae]|uniref:DUF2567 domain-containing protein n=1 Tax=Parafrankia colletiae TaxID=573497 RepID=A0A1S1RD73_9ACTN|nr:hypothetical protein [Parafrankia colletiae]MCK9900494.1 hypothetical protein [Frankia sp. Cpl3]OHV43172.1 hypothetical protein CC117_11185 [Parafrankia colletiae]
MAERPGGTRDAGECSGPQADGRSDRGPVPGTPVPAAESSAPAPERTPSVVSRPTTEPFAPAPPAPPGERGLPADESLAGPAAAVGTPAPLERERARAEPEGTRARLLAGLVCALAMVVAGPLLGLLWAATAPRLDVDAALAGAMSVFGAQSTTDLYFALICAVAGVVGGLLAGWRAAGAGWPVPVGLAAGGVVGSLLAGWTGQQRRSGEVLASLPPNATALLRDLAEFHVRATGLYLVLPGMAVLVLALFLWAGGTTLGWPWRRR